MNSYVLQAGCCPQSAIVELYLVSRQIPYDRHPIDIGTRENESDPFLADSPSSSLPVLTISSTGDSFNEKIVLSGPLAIVDFLETFHDPNIVALPDLTLSKRAKTLQLKSHVSVTLLPALSKFCASIQNDFLASGVDRSKARFGRHSFLFFERLLDALDFVEVNLQLSELSELGKLFLIPVLLHLTRQFRINLPLFRLVGLQKLLDDELNHREEFYDAILQDIHSEEEDLGLVEFQHEFVSQGLGREIIGVETILPTNYVVRLQPHSSDFIVREGTDYGFDGALEMTFDVLQPTVEIVLNANKLEIENGVQDVELVCSETVRRRPVRILRQNRLERFVFVFREALRIGEGYVLKIRFQGEINDTMTGVYRSKYEMPPSRGGDVTKFMAVTQFACTGARMVFPCVDEPGVKVAWSLTLVVPRHFVAISNMPAFGDFEIPRFDETQAWGEVRFHESVKMSSYLYAFCIVDGRDYGCVERLVRRDVDLSEEEEESDGEGEDVVRIRVWSRKPTLELGAFALECCVRSLPLYEKYFEEKYPLPKLDCFAVSELAAGAMENWGLITFRENAVLLGPSSAIAMKQRVALFVTHEFAHQWFGNLVTFDWWVDLWLNEGFATWCQYFLCETLFPEMKIWQHFVTHAHVSALKVDSLASSHAIEIHLTKASQVDEIFDMISYEKGCCVIRMIVEFLGIDVFRKGVCAYLAEFKYRNATTQDLWTHLSMASGKNVKSLMQFWTQKVGYPVVEASDREGRIVLSQRRFLSSGPADPESCPVWPIPLSYRTSLSGVGVEEKLVMSERTMEIDFPEGADWIKFNPDYKGFYRVHYDEVLLERLQTNIAALSEEDRFSLLADMRALIKCGSVRAHVGLAFLDSLKDETSVVVLEGMVSLLSFLRTLVEFDEDALRLYNTFALGILRKMKLATGTWNPGETDFIRIQLQKLVVTACVLFEDADLVAHAVSSFSSDSALSGIAADLRAVCTTVAVKEGGRKAFDQVIALFQSSSSDEIKIRCLIALARTKEPVLQREAIDFMLTDAVKKQDKIYLFESFCRNKLSRENVWEHFVSFWDTYCEMYSGTMLHTDYVSAACRLWDTNEQADRVVQFFEQHPCPAVSMTVEQGVEAIRTQAAFVEREQTSLIAWLREKQ